jgi:hypothetical protein
LSERIRLGLGQNSAWEIPDKDTDTSATQPDQPFRIETRKYSDRTWAVYVNGELICATVYKKGAFAVESVLGELWQRIQDAEGRTRI